MREKNKDRYFYHKWWFWVIISMLFLGSGTLFLIKDTNFLGNLIGLISAWMGVVATIFIGIIATHQNKKYKEDGDEFNHKQEELTQKQQELVQKQHDFEIYKNIMDVRIQYVNKVKQDLQNFVVDFDYKKIVNILAEMEVCKNEKRFEETDYSQRIMEFKDRLCPFYIDLKQAILNDWRRTDTNMQLGDLLDDYFITLTESIETINYLNISQVIAKMNQTFANKLLEIYRKKQTYVTELDVDLNMILTTRSEDLNFVQEHYTYQKEKNNG